MVQNICLVGKEQSPINIISKKSKKCGATCELTFYYRNSKCNIIRLPNNIVIDYDVGSYVTYKNDTYELNKISFTNPSSHKIDNSSYPLEAHLYHRSSNTGSILILAVFVDINNAISKSKIFLDSFGLSIPNKNGNQISLNMTEDWNIYHILPENKAFFSYNGSIIKKPCSQSVIWIVMDASVNCSEEFYNKLLLSSKNNARSIQKINSRTIYYNPNNSERGKHNYGNQLRCYTETEFKNKCKKLSGNSEISKSNTSKNIIISIIIIFIVFLILFGLWLNDKGILNKFIKNLNNILNNKILNQ